MISDSEQCFSFRGDCGRNVNQPEMTGCMHRNLVPPIFTQGCCDLLTQWRNTDYALIKTTVNPFRNTD